MKCIKYVLIAMMICGSALGRDRKYFVYELDCGDECVRKSESCTIAEPEHYVFVRDCYTDLTVCEEKASPVVVCLSKYKEPSGGALIWNDYWTYNFPDKHRSLWYIYTIIGIIIFFVGTTLGCVTQPFVRGYIVSRRSNYERIPSGSGVYQSTVVPVARDGRDDGNIAAPPNSDDGDDDA